MNTPTFTPLTVPTTPAGSGSAFAKIVPTTAGSGSASADTAPITAGSGDTFAEMTTPPHLTQSEKTLWDARIPLMEALKAEVGRQRRELKSHAKVCPAKSTPAPPKAPHKRTKLALKAVATERNALKHALAAAHATAAADRATYEAALADVQKSANRERARADKYQAQSAIFATQALALDGELARAVRAAATHAAEAHERGLDAATVTLERDMLAGQEAEAAARAAGALRRARLAESKLEFEKGKTRAAAEERDGERARAVRAEARLVEARHVAARAGEDNDALRAQLAASDEANAALRAELAAAHHAASEAAEKAGKENTQRTTKRKRGASDADAPPPKRCTLRTSNSGTLTVSTSITSPTSLADLADLASSTSLQSVREDPLDDAAASAVDSSEGHNAGAHPAPFAFTFAFPGTAAFSGISAAKPKFSGDVFRRVVGRTLRSATRAAGVDASVSWPALA